MSKASPTPTFESNIIHCKYVADFHLSENGKGNDGPSWPVRGNKRREKKTSCSQGESPSEADSSANTIQQAWRQKQYWEIHHTANEENKEDIAAELRGVQGDAKVGHAKREPAERHEDQAA